MERETFGALLRQYRVAAGLTQEALAEQAHLSARALSSLERGARRKPRQDTLAFLAEALHLAPEARARLEASVSRARRPASLAAPPPPVGRALPRRPVPLTRLIGREREESSAAHLLQQEEVRLLTLTGPPGVGKTRLALQLAESLADTFADGVHVVSLAALQEPSLVLSALAEALDVREAGGLSLLDHLETILYPQQRLLVLDNFEHLLAAAPLLVELLAACPGVKALVTSRARLQVRGEYELVVPPLALPDPTHLPALADLGQYGAVTLLVARARAVKPTFALTERLAPLVAELCVRLDGLPLAIELAAARLKLLPLATLLAQLEDRLALLTGGARDLPERQQTMRQAIGWSYDLLSAEQQQRFRRLAVFAGPWTLAAAAQICGSPEASADSLLESVATLVDHSLVQSLATPEAEEPRFQLLETLRAYGLEQLEQAGEASELHQRHAAFYLALAEEVEPALVASAGTGADQAEWLARLTSEQDNLRAALWWTYQADQGALGLQLASALWLFWYLRGQLTEGRRWLEEGLAWSRAHPDAVPIAVRMRALKAAGTQAYGQGDYTAARAHLEEGVAFARQAGDPERLSAVLNNLAITVCAQGDYARARVLHEENLALGHARGDRSSLASTLLNLGQVVAYQGELAQAEGYTAQSLPLFREIGDRDGEALALQNLGELAWQQGQVARAEPLLEEALECFRALEDPLGVALALSNLGQVARAQGAWERAETCFVESLRQAWAVGAQEQVAISLNGLAGGLAEQGQWERAAHLFGRAAALREAIGAPGSPVERQSTERDLDRVRVALGEEAFTVALTAGRALSLNEVLAEDEPAWTPD